MPHMAARQGKPRPGDQATRGAVMRAGHETGAPIASLDASPNSAHSASMFICGDVAAANATIGQLAGNLGFDPVNCGPLSQARLLELSAMRWISMTLVHGPGQNIAFLLLRK